MAALALYAAVLALLWWKQEALLFHPQPLAADHRLATEPDVHEERVQVPGATLSVLHLRLRELEAMDRTVSHVTVPLSYADELYALPANIHLVRGRLGATAPAATPA